MGFKGLKAFNMAMLGKQAWKILTQPDSLITRLFKARYFPNSDYFAASSGHNPSYVWRSLWNVKHVVRNGLKWSIGTGTNISVWDPSWICNNYNIPQPHLMNQAMADLKVSNLLVLNYKQWHTENIYLLFDNVSANIFPGHRILHRYSRIDQHGSSKKMGSIQSATFIETSRVEAILFRSTTLRDGGIRFGDANYPPCIKNFVWCVARGCLPSRVRLQTRGVNCTTQCPFCDSQEDNLHVLFLCPKSIQCWQKLGLWNDISTTIFNLGSISFILFEIIQRLHNSKHSLFGTLMWSIWKNRNNKVWNDSSESCQAICNRATSFLASWEHAQELKQAPLDNRPITMYLGPSLRQVDISVMWTPPFSRILTQWVLRFVFEMLKEPL